MDVLQRDDLPFPRSLPEFQQLFPDEAKCAAYMEKARWGDGFVCPHCHAAGDPFRIATRPGVLRCRKCRHDTGLTVGTVMERSHMPLSTWFWAAYLVASQTSGISAVQFQRQLGLSRYETAFGILHKLRAGMVRPNQDRIGGKPGEHVEIDETWVGGRTRGEGRGVHHKVLVACAVEVRHRKPGTAQDKRKDGRYAGRVRLAVVPDRSADSLCGFVESAVAPRTLTVTDDWSGYASLGKRGYEHFAVAECGDPEVAEDYLPIIHLVANTPADGGPLPNQYDRQMKLPPGSRLVREWHGRSHTVEVLDAGFLCDGRHYGSLSEVARTITGARWSGPRFFGI